MIADLTPADVAWLKTYFAPPNELAWDALETRTAPQAIVDHILPWLHLLRQESSPSPILLPFVQAGEIRGWYATTRGSTGGFELKSELMAWFGPTYLSRFEEIGSNTDAMANAMRERFGGTVYRFAGPNPATTAKIAERVTAYAGLSKRRPVSSRSHVRPIGAIRADFERALLVQDSNRAELLIAELRGTGRLNEENLRYLDVRLKAGLGLWPQIARDHWLVKTLAELHMPAQILADIIEALFRTYVDAVETTGDPKALLSAFEQQIAKPYPRLFASRRGIKSPRVVKAFLLFEGAQSKPSPEILADLAALLPPNDPALPLYTDFAARGTSLAATTQLAEPPVRLLDEESAEEAFGDEQYDRAFAQFLALPLNKRSVQRLLTCVLFIDTTEARQLLLDKIDAADSAILAGLSDRTRAKIEGLRTTKVEVEVDAAPPAQIGGWMRWAEALTGQDTIAATSALESVLTWDVTTFAQNESHSRRFADLVGNLSGESAAVARIAVPTIYSAFFPDGQPITAATKPIAVLLFDLIALDDTLSATDLELLSLLLGQLLAVGLSTADYSVLLSTLEDVQDRVGSYMHLTWSLDVCEALAIAPAPSDQGRQARREFFRKVINQTQAFAHRLQRQDILPFDFLRHDFDLEGEVLGQIKLPEPGQIDAEAPDLSGRMIAIYTLAEAAGSRAKAALEAMFPGVRVSLNSDTVATARLSSLARSADVFVFAWKSSSHQAFYCVKEAMGDRDPVMAAGKGTSSILRAVVDNLR